MSVKGYCVKCNYSIFSSEKSGLDINEAGYCSECDETVSYLVPIFKLKEINAPLSEKKRFYRQQIKKHGIHRVINFK